LSIGSDTALNNIVDAVDKIKQSAVATRRCFVVEVSGRYCGYLALMSGLASGAEQVFLHESKVSLSDLQEELDRLIKEFGRDRRLALMIRNEKAYGSYDTRFMTALFNEEGGDTFDARSAILGHLQQGGNPSPFDRILATRFADECVQFLVRAIEKRDSLSCAFVGIQDGRIEFTALEEFQNLVEMEYMRSKDPWWLHYREIAELTARKP